MMIRKKTMSDENKVLDLDELFGQARAVKVKWQGKEYELLQMDAISPKQSLLFQKMVGRVQKLQAAQPNSGEHSEEEDEKNAVELEALVNECLKLLCAELPVETIPFGRRMQIMMFYSQETQGKKALEVALSNLSGATASQS
jgi:hypothetical protein